MATTLPYYEQKDIENIKKLREMTKTLPPFCTDFFVGSNHELLPGPGLPMLMISLFFSISSKRKSGFFQNGTNGFYIRSFGSDHGNRSGRIYGIFKISL